MVDRDTLDNRFLSVIQRKLFDRFGLKQSFFIPAWCMEQYPDAVEAILKGGHEIGHHGYLHEDPIEKMKLSVLISINRRRYGKEYTWPHSGH